MVIHKWLATLNRFDCFFTGLPRYARNDGAGGEWIATAINCLAMTGSGYTGLPRLTARNDGRGRLDCHATLAMTDGGEWIVMAKKCLTMKDGVAILFLSKSQQ